MGSGGHNRSHRTIDDFRRVDSFGLRRLMDNSVGLRWEVFDRAAIYCDFVAGTVEISQDGEYQPLKLEKAGGFPQAISMRLPPRRPVMENSFTNPTSPVRSTWTPQQAQES